MGWVTTSLRKHGSTHLGLCPFHQEKTPSFTVSAEQGALLLLRLWRGRRRRPVPGKDREPDLLLRLSSSSVSASACPSSTKRAADQMQVARAGLTTASTPKTGPLSFTSTSFGNRRRAEGARDYLEKRGLDKAVCETYRAGYSPPGWRGLRARAVKEGFTDRELEDTGLLVRQNGRDVRPFPRAAHVPLGRSPGQSSGFWREDASRRGSQVSELPRGAFVPERAPVVRAVSSEKGCG